MSEFLLLLRYEMEPLNFGLRSTLISIACCIYSSMVRPYLQITCIKIITSVNIRTDFPNVHLNMKDLAVSIQQTT